MAEGREFEDLMAMIGKKMEGGAASEAEAAARRASEATAEKDTEKLTNAMSDLTRAIQTATNGKALEDLTEAAERYGTAGRELIDEAKALEGSSAKLSETLGKDAGKGSRPSEPTPPAGEAKEGVGLWGWTKRAGALLFGTTYVWDSRMQSASQCYERCKNRTNDTIEPVGMDDSIPPNLKQPNCPDDDTDAECFIYCSKTGRGACTEQQRKDSAQYKCGMSAHHPDPLKAADCTADAARKGVDSVFDFWDTFGLYIMYIAIVIGVLVALYAFKIYTSAYVSKTSRNIKNRAYASGNRTQGAFYSSH